MYKLHHLFISLFLALVVLTCDRNLVKGDSFVVGFSQCTTDSDWRVAMHQAMYRELAFHPEIDLIIKDADSDNEKQVEHIQEFIDDQVDLIIVSPNESDPITPIVEAAVKRDIPVMVLDRRTSSSIYDAYVGGDNYTIGKIAGNYCRRMLEDGGKVLEIWGLTGSSPAIDRHLGFVDEIGKYPDIELAGRISGSWMRDTVKNQLKELVDLYEDVDLVYAHNDIMALGAYEIFKENGLEDKLYIGVDGLLGPTGGIQLVDEGILDATLLYPTGGEDAIRLAAKILKGESYDKENMLQTTVIDSSNVRIMKLQAERIDAQKKDIARQGEKISEQIRLYRTQQIYLVILIASLLLVIILGGIVYASLKANQKVNKELATKNEEVIEMADKAEQATSAQFKFFTNISHEFRTPLTLILASIDDI
ncbi:MAG: substrate-binding domain-containing protein, partial [Bacteroidota bacterium]